MKKLIDVYPYRISDNKIEFLILKRSEGKIYADQWRMIGGKVKEGEAFWQGALRELNEETGLKPDKFWVVPGINSFYEAGSDTIHHIPVFAAQFRSNDEIILDDEHSGHKWITAEQVSDHLHWPEQQRMIGIIQHILEDPSNRLLPEWEIKI